MAAIWMQSVLQQGLPDSSRAQAVLDYHFVNLHWDDDYFPFGFVHPLRYSIPEDSLIQTELLVI